MPPPLSIAPIFPVRDLQASIRFYNAMGFKGEAWEDGTNYAMLSRDGANLHLGRSDMLVAGQNAYGAYFYLLHGTAATLQAEFLSAGVPILSPLAIREWKMNEFVISDPDGNLLRFGEPLI